jgi:cyclophilin family peptidyl-prolyl cis-trans isomerase
LRAGGNTECFINLGENTHLDAAYGGYCVFAEVAPDDAASFAVVDQIAAMVKGGRKTRIDRVLAV